MKASQDTMLKALQASFRNGEITLSDVRDVLQVARELHDVESVIFLSTVNYKYQADTLISCTREGAQAKIPEHIQLTEKQYRALAQGYGQEPLSDQLLPGMPGRSVISCLHAGIMRNGQFFGLIAFLCSKNRIWTDAEKETLKKLRLLVLFYLGMNSLSENGDKSRLYAERANGENVLSCYHLDFTTKQCHAVKAPPHVKRAIQEWMPYESLINIYVNKFLDPVYGKILLDRCSLAHLKEALSSENGPVYHNEYPCTLNGKTDWLRFTAEALDYDEDGYPLRAMILVKDITPEAQQRAFLAHDLGGSRNNYALIANVDLDADRYAISIDNRLNTLGSTALNTFGSYTDALAFIRETILDEDIRHEYQQLFCTSNMLQAFDSGQTELYTEIRCMVKDRIWWIRVEALPEKNYRPGHRMVVNYFTDITKKKDRDIRFKEMSKSLEAERQHSSEAKIQATTDPLTGAFNRAGFDQYVASIENTHESVGLLALDIDFFKDLNDTHGHAFGDEALTKTVSLVRNAFRSCDKIFRMGGDEFIVILPGCNADAWTSIQQKLAAVHKGLRTSLSQDATVTLSAGLLISEQGYSKELAELADEALYNTKLNGRAGLTQIGIDHTIMRTWNDTSGKRGTRQAQCDVGTWRLVYPSDSQETPRLFLDEAACLLLEVPPTLTPEECYARWINNVSPRHLSLLQTAKDKVMATGKAECTHTWIHPSKKKLSIHARAHCDLNSAKKELTGFLTIMSEDDVVRGHDDAQFLLQALNSVSFCSYYICLADKEYYIIKGHDDDPDVDALHTNADKMLAAFVETFVHPDFRDRVTAFCQLDTLARRMRGRTYLDCDYLSASHLGWCSSRILPVKWDSQGNLTHVLCSSSVIEGHKREELESTQMHGQP